MGPDAATCALVAASIAPLAPGDQVTYASLSVTLAFLTGLLCVAAVVLSIILGQASKIFGFAVSESGIIPRLLEIIGKLGEVHGPTFAVALGTFAIIALVPRFAPQLPAALVGMVLAGAAVVLFNLTAFGVKTVGYVPAGLPPLALPHFAQPSTSGRRGRSRAGQFLEPDAYGAKLRRQERL